MSPAGDAFRRLFGGLLLGIGILIATLSGLCSVVVLAVGSAGRPGEILTVLWIGGIPFGIGIVLILFGRAILRGG